MNRFRKSAARVLSLAMAIVIAASSALLCAPIAALAEAPDHCRPAAVKQACTHCPVQDVLDCCENPEQQPASVPAQGQAARVSLDQSHAPAGAAALVTSPSVPAQEAVLRHAPPHGYRSTDLRTLNATLLI